MKKEMNKVESERSRNNNRCNIVYTDKSCSFVGVSSSLSTLHSADGSMAQSVAELHKKLDRVSNCLASLKIDILDFKEKHEQTHNSENVDIKQEINFPAQFPMKSLNGLETFDAFLKENAKGAIYLANTLKSIIDGCVFKDFTHRLCRLLFSNSLAILCSWTGRKNNFPIENLEVTKIMYDVVHQKSKSSKKGFEIVIMEWFRHARQRKQRKEKRNDF